MTITAAVSAQPASALASYPHGIDETLAPRKDSFNSIGELLLAKGLSEKTMPGDGDCLFHSVLDQLAQHKIEYFVDRTTTGHPIKPIPQSTQELRQLAADFLPFLPEIWQTYSPSEIGDKMKEAAIPGHWNDDAHDLLPYALAQALNINLSVLQDGRTIPLNEAAGVAAFPQLNIVRSHAGAAHYNSTALAEELPRPSEMLPSPPPRHFTRLDRLSDRRTPIYSIRKQASDNPHSEAPPTPPRTGRPGLWRLRDNALTRMAAAFVTYLKAAFR